MLNLWEHSGSWSQRFRHTEESQIQAQSCSGPFAEVVTRMPFWENFLPPLFTRSGIFVFNLSHFYEPYSWCMNIWKISCRHFSIMDEEKYVCWKVYWAYRICSTGKSYFPPPQLLHPLQKRKENALNPLGLSRSRPRTSTQFGRFVTQA